MVPSKVVRDRMLDRIDLGCYNCGMQRWLMVVAGAGLILLANLPTKGPAMSEKSNSPGSPTGNDGRPGPAVTRELFLKWRSPRFGTANPERMNNPVWEWLVRSKLDAYQATQRLRGPSALKAGPGWCFQRFGQSSTTLPDGRNVLIAGEHEDSYDPDFYIYNDVVVLHPNGSMDIFGYPREEFAPTDFHSATLVSNRLVLIGNLGYPHDRRPGRTPVMVLDLTTFAITQAQTSGNPPGWIHAQQATLSEDGGSILVQGGKLDPGKAKPSIENIDDWRLHLADWRWERLTERRWPRWEVRRKDGEMNHLFDYQQALWAKQMPATAKAGEELARLKKQLEIPSLEEALGGPPDLDLYERLYQPSVAHKRLPKSETEHGVHRISVDGVVVRYVEAMDSIQMTVEGDLPSQTLDALTRDLLDKFSKLERSPCVLTTLRSARDRGQVLE